MPLRNRVTPLGELIVHPARGLVYGNRGCLHDANGEIRRRYQVKRWIACRLEFKGRRRAPLMQPGRYTELFFLDEATAFAAGHRPCAECRRADYDRFTEIWRDLHDESGADAIDARLHEQRERPHDAPLRHLPDGTFLIEDGEPWLVSGDELLLWTPAGYTTRRPRRGHGRVITPPSLVEVLRRGWGTQTEVPFLHPSAS